jgi:glycogen debranching enzyme
VPQELQATARTHAEQLLLGNGGELGLLGSNAAYRQVWARDSMLCGLGLVLCHNPEGTAIFKRSLDTLRQYQSPLGKIPHSVGLAGVLDPALIAHGGTLEDTGERVVLDTAHAGCVDNNLWYILGHVHYYRATRNLSYLREVWPSLEAALLWLRYQDSNECGLLEVHEAMDWADLFANRYNVLYDNVLYVACWRAMAELAEALGISESDYALNAQDVHQKVNTVLWVGPEAPKDWHWIAGNRREWLYTLRRIETELVERPYYLPYVAFRDYADRFDTLGNLLAILFGVATEVQSQKILDYIHGCGLNEPYPVQALYPVIHEGGRDWREYYRVRNLNQPHHYHNGGAWPFIGGIYVAALVKAGRLSEARRELGKLTTMNRQGRIAEWEFNEWCHGTSGRPMGYPGQSWSTAMYIVAYEAVQRGEVPVFAVEPEQVVG